MADALLISAAVAAAIIVFCCFRRAAADIHRCYAALMFRRFCFLSFSSDFFIAIRRRYFRYYASFHFFFRCLLSIRPPCLFDAAFFSPFHAIFFRLIFFPFADLRFSLFAAFDFHFRFRFLPADAYFRHFQLSPLFRLMPLSIFRLIFIIYVDAACLLFFHAFITPRAAVDVIYDADVIIADYASPPPR